MITLRDYQQAAHDGIVEKFKMNLKTLLVMATGSGKSKTIVSFIKKYEKHFTFILAVKNRKLVNQLAEDTKLFNLDYGVFMASHDEFDTTKEIQVCSIDTIATRGEYPHIQTNKDIILIIDEADQAKSPTFQTMINEYLNRKVRFPYKAGRTFLLGMTATPYNGLDFFDCFINPITPKQLRDRGFLVDYRYFIPKDSITYEDIEIQKGEWSSSQVAKKLNTPDMILNSFNAWLSHGEDRQTLVFCVDKKHAIAMKEFINNYYGKTQAEFVYDKTSDQDRGRIFDDFENGRIRFLINIRIITRGVDIPCIGTILDLASTLRLNLHIQKLGRGSRKNPFYNDCIVIDMVKNVLNNGHFYMEHEIDLKNPIKKLKKDLEDTLMRVCSKCFRAAETADFGGKNICPYCSHPNGKIPKKQLSKYKQDKIFMESATEEQIEQKKMISEFKKSLWKYQNIGKRYRYDIAKKYSCIDLLKKYPNEKVLKIQKSIGLKQEWFDEYKRKYEYQGIKL